MKKRILYNILNEWRDEDEDDIPIDLDNMKFEPTSSDMDNEPNLDDDDFALSTTKEVHYEYFPETRRELIDIIKEEFYKQGNENVNLNMIDTSKITDMSFMFERCRNLQTLDVSRWDVSNVTNMRGMFIHCNSLKTLDVSRWDVSNVKDMQGMFFNCWILHTDITMWTINTRNREDMYYDAPNIKHN